mgnify:CR=1 FL=1
MSSSELKPHGVYRLSHILADKRIAGKPAIFVRYWKRSFDIQRAVMRLMNADGSEGDEYLVSPCYILPIK